VGLWMFRWLKRGFKANKRFQWVSGCFIGLNEVSRLTRGFSGFLDVSLA